MNALGSAATAVIGLMVAVLVAVWAVVAISLVGLARGGALLVGLATHAIRREA